MSQAEHYRPHGLSFSQYLEGIVTHIQTYAPHEYDSPTSARIDQVFELQRSPLWQAAYSVSTGLEFNDHPFMVGMNNQGIINGNLDKLVETLVKDEDNLTKSLERYFLYRMGAVYVVNRVFRDVLKDAVPDSSVTSMKYTFEQDVVAVTQLLRVGDLTPLPHFLVEDALSERGHYLLSGLAAELPALKMTIADNIFDMVITAQQNGSFDEITSVAGIENTFPLPDYLFTRFYTPLPHSHTTCPAMEHSRVYYQLLVAKALPYWNGGGSEEELVGSNE